MFETGMSALVLKICSEYAKALGLSFPPCVQQEINAIAQYVDLHTVKDIKVEQNGSVVTITCFTEGEQEKVFTVTLPEVNVDVLFNLIKGSSSVVVDKSEDGTNIVVRLDKSQEVQYVELTPASAIRGILTDTQLNILETNKGNCIIRNNEIYRLADNQNVSGLITYVHTGWDGTSRLDKTISITVSTKAWILIITESGGVKLYQHRISFTADFSDDSGATICDISFLIISRKDTEYTLEEFATIFNTYGSSFIALLTITLPETGDMPYSGLGKVVFSELADVLEVRAYYSANDSVNEYHKTGSYSNVSSLTDDVTEL
nr:MAG TPA: hypothetical protein [Caudoviricetes sp.]